MDIGEKIREIRKQIGISQKELGEKLGVSQQHIAQYENGKRKPKLETFVKIADALEIDFQEFLDLDEEDKKRLSSGDWMDIDKDLNFEVYTPTNEERLKRAYEILNPIGKNEAAKRVEELTEIERYVQKDES